jgi:hypothetical protein
MANEPKQMYENELNPVKGWPSPYAVDKVAVLADSDAVVKPGMVCSLDSNAELVLGLESGAMALFAFPNSADFDVRSDAGGWVGPSTKPNGSANMLVLPAKGAYELESTEFDAEEAYAPNDTLTAGAPGDGDAGVIKPGTAYTNTICGVVSDGVRTNEYQIKVLRFWPVWLPPFAGSN